jgi:hypothetical protein
MDLKIIFGNLFQNLLTLFILLVIFILVYCKLKNKSLVEVIQELREAIKGE